MSEIPLGNPNSDNRRYLHLKEINVVFNDRRPNSKFSVKIEVAGEKTYQSPVFGRNKNIEWKCDRFVVSSATANLTIRKSRLSKLKIMKKYSSFDVKFGADNICEDGTVQLGSDPRFTVNLIFGASRPLQDVARLLSNEATTALASKVVLLDNIDKILNFSETIMGFAEVAAELNSIAELVVKALKAAHENCQKISRCHNDAITLMGEMVSLICLPELVNDKIKEPATKEAMDNFLVLVKDAADALTEYASPSGISFYARNWFKPKCDSFAKLRQRFTAVKQNMDLYLGASTYLVVHETQGTVHATHEAVLGTQGVVHDIHQMTDNTYEQQMLDRLHPVLKAHYDPDHSCLQGTRADILHDICDWAISHQDPQTKLFWLYGIAGSGKSSIASSVASSLDQQGCLAGCFFFKRDIPECRSPQHFVSTLAYYIARACKPFRDVMLQVLQDDPDIASKAVRLQFETLFTGPLSKSSQLSSPKPLVMIIDALDECQDAGSVSAYLAQLAGLTSWLKIFVTSRPLPEIEKGLYPAITFMRKFDLYHANAHSDIFQYTRTWLLQVIGNDDANFVEEKALALTKKASGLFIWISTVFRFLKVKLNKLAVLQQILSSDPAQNPEAELDKLYTTVLTSLSQGDQDNIAIIQWILGAISVTARNRPLSSAALADFLSNHSNELIPVTVLLQVISALQAVLYKDSASGGTIRVCHPSFLDFIDDKKRSKTFWKDSKDVDSVMATTCLQIMQSKLKFNICNLESSYIKNTDIADLQDRISTCIPLSLQYSCLYWMNHYSMSNLDLKVQTVWTPVKEVLCEPRVLFWLEALSLLGQLNSSIDILTQSSICFQHCTEIESVCQDLYRFVSAFYEPMETSTAHIYVSALSWVPTRSYIAKHFYSYFSNQPSVSSGKADHWESILWTAKAQDEILCVAYSPDGKHIASGSYDSAIYIWDAQTGKAIGKPLTGHSDSIRSVAYSPDGRHIASGSWDRTICIWDSQTGKAVGEPLIGHSDWVHSVAYSPDGRHIVSGSRDSTICIWDAHTGKAVGEPLTGHSDYVTSVAYSPDGRHIASGSADNTICIWNIQTGKLAREPLAGHSGRVTSVVYSPDGRHIASGSWDRTICIWDSQTGVLVGEPLTGHSGDVLSVAYSPDGRHVVSGSGDKTICIWDAHTGKVVGEPLTGHSNSVYSAVYSPDGRHIASGSWDKTICIWDIQIRKSVGEPLTGHSNSVYSVAYSPDGRYIVSGSADHTICIWDSQTGMAVGEPLTGHSSSVFFVAYSPDGRHIASGFGNKIVCIWDVKTGMVVGEPLTGHSRPVNSVAYSPDGRYIASASADNTICIWDVQTGNRESLAGHSDIVNSVAYSPDGRHIASGSWDRTICIWDSQTMKAVGKPLTGHLQGVTSVSYSPDGRHIASGSWDRTICIWDAQTGKVVGEPLTGHSSEVISVTYSPDGRHVASGSVDKTICIWDSQTGKVVGEPLTGHSKSVYSVAYSPDGRYIVSGSDDHTICTWNQDVDSVDFKTRPRLPSKISDDGWLKNSAGELLIWVPHEHREAICYRYEMCISHIRPRSPPKLDWQKFDQWGGTSWVEIYKGRQ